MEDGQERKYLQQLYRESEGDLSAVVSMYEVGAGIGLDKAEAGALAEDLIIDGLAELKNLAGGVSLTVEGLRALGVETDTAGGNGRAEETVVLGRDEVVGAEAVAVVIKLLAGIKAAASATDLGYDRLEEIVIEIRTLEVQLLSRRPKTAIVRAVLASLANLLPQAGDGARLSAPIRGFLGER